METCCGNSYSNCLPLIGCFTELVVFTPLDYIEETIKIRITKSTGSTLDGVFDVNTGAVVLAVIDYAPGFFNSYAGIYTLEFFDPAQPYKPMEFIARDGNPYVSILFRFIFAETDETAAVLNIFDDSIYN